MYVLAIIYRLAFSRLSARPASGTTAITFDLLFSLHYLSRRLLLTQGLQYVLQHALDRSRICTNAACLYVLM